MEPTFSSGRVKTMIGTNGDLPKFLWIIKRIFDSTIIRCQVLPTINLDLLANFGMRITFLKSRVCIHVYIGGGVGAGGQFLGEFKADKTNHNFDSTLRTGVHKRLSKV